MRKLRVLIIISSPEMGGIEKQLLSFLQRYDREKFIIDVACGRGTEGVLRDRYLATGSKLILCRWSKYIIPFVWRLLRLLQQKQYDVVHAHFAEVNGAPMLSAWLAGVPTRIASYDHTKTHWRKPGLINQLVVRFLQRINYLLATKIVGDAEICLDVYYPGWRQISRKFDICYDGIDIEQVFKSRTSDEVKRELGLPVDSLVIGHVGRFSRVKNHETIVNMAEQTAKQFDNAYFLLVGDGELRPDIEQEVNKRGLTSKFVFAGHRSDVPRMLSVMDVFIMPSLDEGFGLAVAEAQLSGLAVVASDIPGICEALCPEMRRFCRKPNDSAGMAEQAMLILKKPELRNKLGQAGKEYVADRFSIDRYVKQLESLYDRETDH